MPRTRTRASKPSSPRMPTNTLEAVAIVVGATFLLGMLVGIVLMLGSAIVRRRGSALAARLLLSGPPGGLLAAMSSP